MKTKQLELFPDKSQDNDLDNQPIKVDKKTAKWITSNVVKRLGIKNSSKKA